MLLLETWSKQHQSLHKLILVIKICNQPYSNATENHKWRSLRALLNHQFSCAIYATVPWDFCMSPWQRNYVCHGITKNYSMCHAPCTTVYINVYEAIAYMSHLCICFQLPHMALKELIQWYAQWYRSPNPRNGTEWGNTNGTKPRNCATNMCKHLVV